MPENKKDEAVRMPQKLGISKEREAEIEKELQPVYDRMIDKLIEEGRLDADSLFEDAHKIAKTTGEALLVGILATNTATKIRSHVSSGPGLAALKLVSMLEGIKNKVETERKVRSN